MYLGSSLMCFTFWHDLHNKTLLLLVVEREPLFYNLLLFSLAILYKLSDLMYFLFWNLPVYLAKSKIYKIFCVTESDGCHGLLSHMILEFLLQMFFTPIVY